MSLKPAVVHLDKQGDGWTACGRRIYDAVQMTQTDKLVTCKSCKRHIERMRRFARFADGLKAHGYSEG